MNGGDICLFANLRSGLVVFVVARSKYEMFNRKYQGSWFVDLSTILCIILLMVALAL